MTRENREGNRLRTRLERPVRSSFVVHVFLVSSVRWVERYRAPHLPSPDAGANPGPDPVRQGANFADMTCCGINTRTIDSEGVIDGVMTCPHLSVAVPCPPFRATCAKRTGFPGACRLNLSSGRIHEGLSWNFGPDFRMAFVSARSLCRGEPAETGF